MTHHEAARAVDIGTRTGERLMTKPEMRQIVDETRAASDGMSACPRLARWLARWTEGAIPHRFRRSARGLARWRGWRGTPKKRAPRTRWSVLQTGRGSAGEAAEVVGLDAQRNAGAGLAPQPLGDRVTGSSEHL